MKTKLLILFFILLTIKLYALTSPELHCIAVNNDGSITLTWTIPTDTSGFSSYHIFSSNIASGPFQDIGNVTNVNQTTYVDNTINANNQSYYYYVNCLSTTGTYTTPTSDTLQSILLIVTSVGGGSVANLVWNPIHTPPLNTTSLYYSIYREKYSTGTWMFLDSTLATQYNDVVDVCHDTLNYRIEIGDASGCTSISSIEGNLFIDQTPPVSIVIDTVSVDNTIGNVVIAWETSPSVDTKGYYICRGSPCTTLATINGKLNTFYTDVTSTPFTSSFTYRIAAFDSCGNISIYSNNQNSIFLQTTEDICNDKIDLNWNSYINMNPQLMGYRVMLSINGGIYNSIATLTPGELTYTYTGLTDSTKYCFFIQAYDSANVKTSSSNISCDYVVLAHNPSFLYIRHVSVVNNAIEIKVYTDNTVQINGYNVLRSGSSSGPFTQLMTLPYNALLNFTTTDNSVDVMNHIYYYKIEVINSCGAVGLTSNTAHNILLTTKATDNFTNQLLWNEYGDWAGSVESYDIYRSVDGASYNLIKNILATGPPYIYNDDVTNFSSGYGTFSYYVVANENPNITYNFTEESTSNISILEQSPYIYIPNAFCPQGLNNIFKPVTGFISDQQYSMQIYNRFGQLIFESDNPGIGWDGMQNNKYVQSGVYVYIIRYIMPNSEIIQKTGHVTLVD